MKCPKEIRVCPNGWIDCHLCKYDVLCKAGLYEPDISDLGIVVLAAKIAEKVVKAEAVESAYKIRGTRMEELNRLEEGEKWEWMARYRTPNLHAVEPYKAMSGPTTVCYTHLRAHETRHDLVCRLLLEKKKKT